MAFRGDLGEGVVVGQVPDASALPQALLHLDLTTKEKMEEEEEVSEV
jgi:hypothetical protein